MNYELRPVLNHAGEEPPDPPEPLRDDLTVTYRLVRFHMGAENETLARGLTFAQVTRHCCDERTSGPGWFDGFRMED